MLGPIFSDTAPSPCFLNMSCNPGLTLTLRLTRQEQVHPPGGSGAPPPEPTPGEAVERTPPSFAGGSRIFDIENPEALARDVGGDNGDGAARERALQFSA